MTLRVATRRALLYPKVAAVAAVYTDWWDLDGAVSGCIGAWSAFAANQTASYTDLSGNANDLTFS